MLDQVWFVPAAVPPHKQSRSIATAESRIEMLRLAIGGHNALDVLTLEVERGGVSYTVDTLSALQQADPSRELFLILGADSLHDLPNWRSPDQICELSTLIVARRSGTPEPDFECLASVASSARRQQFWKHQIEMPRIDLSSSEIRARVAQRRSIRYRTPRAVEQYIHTTGLYRTADRESAAFAAPKHSCGE
jgi:nicotinate-nucleotide adenylyltransferase